MSGRKFLHNIMGLAVAGALAFGGAAQAETRVLRLAHPEAPTHPHQVAAEKFKELVELDAFSLVHDLPLAVARIQVADS